MAKMYRRPSRLKKIAKRVRKEALRGKITKSAIKNRTLTRIKRAGQVVEEEEEPIQP